jgi:hypothetical protein
VQHAQAKITNSRIWFSSVAKRFTTSKMRHITRLVLFSFYVRPGIGRLVHNAGMHNLHSPGEATFHPWAVLKQLERYGLAAASMAARNDRQTWKVQLAETRAEWRRRHPKEPES